MTSLVLSSFANPSLLAPIAFAVAALALAWVGWKQQHLVSRALCLGGAVALALAIVAQSAPATPAAVGPGARIATLVPLLGWPVAQALLAR
jgi:hypothetical protein